MRCLLLLGCLLLGAWCKAQSPLDGAFVIRKPPCITDSTKAVLDSYDRTWPGQDIATVSGFVYTQDSLLGNTVANVLVLIYSNDTLFNYAFTNLVGSYLMYLPVGSYTIKTCKKGYSPEERNITLRRAKSTERNIVINTVLQPVGVHPESLEGIFASGEEDGEVPLAPGKVLGVIKVRQGDFPLDKVEVQLWQNDELIATSYCDGTGHYRIDRLEDGLYDLLVVTAKTTHGPLPDVIVRKGQMRVVDLTLTKPIKD